MKPAAEEARSHYGCAEPGTHSTDHHPRCCGAGNAKYGCELLSALLTSRDLAAREECAKVAETFVGGDHIARVIRAKGGAR